MFLQRYDTRLLAYDSHSIVYQGPMGNRRLRGRKGLKGGLLAYDAYQETTCNQGLLAYDGGLLSYDTGYCHTILGYWYTIQGYYHTILGYWHTILISSYTSNPWGTEDLRLWSAVERIYSHTTLARKYREIRA